MSSKQQFTVTSRPANVSAEERARRLRRVYDILLDVAARHEQNKDQAAAWDAPDPQSDKRQVTA